MNSSASRQVAALVEGLTPVDELEAEHHADALAWLASTDDIFRRIPPKTPPKHLVAYFVLHDPVDGSVLLVDHRKAGSWLPTGGHVAAGEDPRDTVRRETFEELGVTAVFADPVARPSFLTVTETNGVPASRHTDVTLWYLLTGARGDVLHPDEREFAAVRWWTQAEVEAADPADVEPHLLRFLAKATTAQ
ncbi:MAG: NUDIX hydrolase [Janthinobacterium lividum]